MAGTFWGGENKVVCKTFVWGHSRAKKLKYWEKCWHKTQGDQLNNCNFFKHSCLRTWCNFWGVSIKKWRKENCLKVKQILSPSLWNCRFSKLDIMAITLDLDPPLEHYHTPSLLIHCQINGNLLLKQLTANLNTRHWQSQHHEGRQPQR